MPVWNDRSGNGNHVTQTTASIRPVFQTNAINGRPAIAFNGTTRQFVLPNQTFSGMTSLDNFTLFTLLRWNGKVTSGIWGTAGPGANAANVHFEIQTGGQVRARLGNLDSVLVPGALASGAWNTLSLVQQLSGEDPGLKLFKNGAAIGALSGEPGLALMANYQGFVLGNSHSSNRYFDGLIAEFILFNNRLTDNDRKGVETYISQKYQLAGALHTNFSISAAGEDIVLTKPDGSAADALPPIAIPGNISRGRLAGGDGTWFFFDKPTPGAANSTTAYVGLLAPPTFSQSPGFQTASHPLALAHTDNLVTIRYTLDGSKPTASSPVYQTPLIFNDRSGEPNGISLIPTNNIVGARGWQAPWGLIKKSNVVRARVERAGYIPAYTTGTFFILPQGANQYDLPVISIATDAANLFSSQTGLFVPGATYVTGNDASGNYAQRGDAWEREAEFEFFDENGTRQMRQTVGLRINGGFTRRFPQKSLRIYARSEYGESQLNYPFFPDEADSSFKRIILRASGNDWGGTMFMDAAAQDLVKHFNVDTQAYRPSIVFINGEYWGIHNIRERYDKYYLERTYGIDPENIDYLSGAGTVEEGDAIHYNQTLNFIVQENLADESKMNQVKTMVDIDNFIDYYSAEIYYGNDDWPHNNIEFWRSRMAYNPTAPAGHDGRWRWLLFDIDRSLGYLTGPEFNMVQWVNRVDTSTLLFRNLLKNPGFKNDMINRMADHLNSAFMPAVVIATVNRLKPPVEGAIAEHIARWTKPASLSEWETKVEGMRTYGTQRPGYMRQHLISQYGIGPSRTITVNVADPAKGSVKVNSMTIDSNLIGIPNPSAPYPWTGSYFQGIPVTVTAVPKPGFRFAGWQGRVDTESSLTLSLTADLSVTALFETDPESLLPSHNLASGPYQFSQWDAASAAGTYPAHMTFEQTAQADPALLTNLESAWTLPYNLTSRSRINGLGSAGVGFINTSSVQDAAGAGFLGSAVLALNTTGQSQVKVTWTGGTVTPNDRVYGIRLQYRLGASGSFIDVPGAQEYVRSTAGHSAVMDPVPLPEAAWNNSYIQLRWKYYYVSGTSGARAQLRLDDISVTSIQLESYADWTLANFPNPADRANPLISGPDVDLMGDGVKNLMRYALDMDIGDASSGFLPRAEILAGRLAIRFIRNPNKTDITYLVEAGPAPDNWNEILYNSASGTGSNNDGVRMMVTDSITTVEAPRRFLRLRVIKN